MLKIADLAEELEDEVQWQETPMPVGKYDYLKIVMRAIREFFVLINRPAEYDTALFVEADGELCYDHDFPADEIEVILVLCRRRFFRKVQTDVNNAFGYSTDALKVTNADKPYANLKDTLSDIENELRIKFNKMVRYTMGES